MLGHSILPLSNTLNCRVCVASSSLVGFEHLNCVKITILGNLIGPDGGKELAKSLPYSRIHTLDVVGTLFRHFKS